MGTAYDGRQVVGIDLHRWRSVLVRMAEDGRRLEMVRITSSPQELRREIARAVSADEATGARTRLKRIGNSISGSDPRPGWLPWCGHARPPCRLAA
jgi:hypothetical protein